MELVNEDINKQDFTFSFAKSSDQDLIKKLLTACHLPHQDIANHLSHFIIAMHKDQLAGVIGVESYQETGLLRSLAVDETYRDLGLAQKLCSKIQDYARAQGIEELYLLTVNAESYFSKLGFKKIERTEAPFSIQDTEEFKKLCPSSAVCMVKTIY